MAASWSIVREDASTASFATARIRNAVKTCINQGVDTCDVYFGFGDLLTRNPWDYDELIQIKRDATVFFRGHVRRHSPSANGSTEELTVQLVGPWWHLENLVYTQFAYFVDDPDANPTPAGSELVMTDFTTSPVLSSKIFIGEDQAGDEANTAEMIGDVLDYAISKGAPLQKGTIDTGIDVPREAYDAITCAEVIRKCLRWTPDQTVYFDYTTSPATIHVRKRSNLSSTTFALADEETEEVAIMARYDLVLPGVRIEYIQNNERDGFTFRSISVDEVGSDTTGIGALIVPVELYGSYLYNGSVVAAETPPTGIAQMIYDHWSQTHYEGRIRIVKEDCAATNWLSYKARVSGGNPEWATMDAVIQSSVDDVFGGRTEITMGPPQHLGVQDLIGLLRAGRTEVPTLEDVLTKAGGGAPRSSRLPADAQDPRLEFDLNHPPNIIIYCHQVYFTGVTWPRFEWDTISVYDTEGGTLLGTTSESNNTSKQGSVFDFHGISVGYSSSYTQHGSEMAHVAAPQYRQAWEAYADTKEIVALPDVDIGGGYSSP